MTALQSQLATSIATGSRAEIPAALNLVETDTPLAINEAFTLLAALSPASQNREAPGHIVGITGPPGAGKSTLLGQLISQYRSTGRSVAVIAVDPSSKRTGGSLLGDRARVEINPKDPDIFMRSMAAGDALGGLARATRSAATILSWSFDIVIVETVGVGQSETDIADVADTIVVVVQPGSGDTLQFIKSGIMEIPDILVVTKADLGSIADKAKGDLRSALRSVGDRTTKVVSVSSLQPISGFDLLIEQIDQHQKEVDIVARRSESRVKMALNEFIREYGASGIRLVGGRYRATNLIRPFANQLSVPELTAKLHSMLK